MTSRLRRSTSARRASSSTSATKDLNAGNGPLPAGRDKPPTDPLPTNGEGMKVSAVLYERCQELKRIAKSVASYYEDLQSIQTTSSKGYLALSNSPKISVPFRNAVFFQSSSSPTSYASLLQTTKDSAARQADQYAQLADQLGEVVGEMKSVRMDVKGFMKGMEANLRVLEEAVVKEREHSTSLLLLLSNALSTIATHPLTLAASSDPYVLRASLESQFSVQISAENDLTSAVLIWQDKVMSAEEKWVERIRKGVMRAEESRRKLQGGGGGDKDCVGVMTVVERLSAKEEWSYFTSLNHLLPSATPLRDPSSIDYPNRHDTSCIPLKEGILERKKRFMRTWSSAFFVITPSGYLHEYPAATSPRSSPSVSLFLPACSLGGLSDKSKFVIEGRKTAGKIKGSLGMKSKELGWVFKGENLEVAKEWWLAVEKMTKHPSKSLADIQGSGPTAVQMIGRPSLDAGSSVEEEAEVAEPVEEEKSAYEPTPGIVVGEKRDLMTKNGLGNGSGMLKQAPVSDAEPPVPSASKHPVFDENATTTVPQQASPAVTATTSPDYFVDAVSTPATQAPVAEEPTTVSVNRGTVDRAASVMREKEVEVEGNGDGEGKKEKKRLFGFGKKK